MKMFKLSIAAIVFVFISGCNIIKTVSLLQSATIENKNYTETIRFEECAGLMIIEVTIKDKTYDFIYDTGAASVISKELANDIDAEVVSRVKSGDSQDNKSKIAFTLIPEIKTGNLTFQDVGAAIIDFNKVQEIKCLNVDGIFGANLMKLAKWQIDYQENTLTVTDNIENLTIPENSIMLDSKLNISGTPMIELNLPGNITVKDVFFDTGFSDEILLNESYFKKLNSKNKDLRTAEGYGFSSAGAFGVSESSTYYASLNSITSCELIMRDIVAEFKGKKNNLIGTGIFSNYKVTIDPDTGKIFLEQVKDIQANTLKTFGFKPVMKDKKLLVGFIFNNSSASNKGLKFGDQILSINEIDYSTITDRQYCDILMNTVTWKTKDTIDIKWKNSEDQVQKAQIKSTDLL